MTFLMLIAAVLLAAAPAASFATENVSRHQVTARGHERASRASFGFVLENGWGDKVDSFRGLVTKDLVAKPDITIPLALAPTEMDSIYRKAIAIHLLEYPEPLLGVDDISPSTWLRLRVKLGDTQREFTWSTGFVPSNVAAKDWDDFNELVQLIWKTVRVKPRYRSLPEPSGGYI